jgi:hypothetical protein
VWTADCDCGLRPCRRILLYFVKSTNELRIILLYIYACRPGWVCGSSSASDEWLLVKITDFGLSKDKSLDEAK